MGNYKPSKDHNQPEIEEALHAAGYYFRSLHNAGDGVHDLIVFSKSGIPVLLEVKTLVGTLTPKQRIFHNLCDDLSVPHALVRTPEGALETMERFDNCEIVYVPKRW